MKISHLVKMALKIRIGIRRLSARPLFKTCWLLLDLSATYFYPVPLLSRCVTKPPQVVGSLCGVFAQLLVSHEELLPLPEGLAHREALVDGLDGGGSDVLDGCYGQGAVFQHELGDFAVASQQSVVQRGVPARVEQRSFTSCLK